MRTTEFEVDTGGRLVTDITDEVERLTEGADGLLHVFLPHATAGLALMETGSGSEEDLEDVVERVWPRDDRSSQRNGPVGPGRAHIVSAIDSPSPVLSLHARRCAL